MDIHAILLFAAVESLAGVVITSLFFLPIVVLTYDTEPNDFVLYLAFNTIASHIAVAITSVTLVVYFVGATAGLWLCTLFKPSYLLLTLVLITYGRTVAYYKQPLVILMLSPVMHVSIAQIPTAFLLLILFVQFAVYLKVLYTNLLYKQLLNLDVRT